jgi:hypothetical protein
MDNSTLAACQREIAEAAAAATAARERGDFPAAAQFTAKECILRDAEALIIRMCDAARAKAERLRVAENTDEGR